MGWVDVTIIVIIVASALFGLARGLIVEVATILGAVAGLYVAKQNFSTATNFLALFFHRDQRLRVIAFIVVFCLVWLLIVLVAEGIRGVLRFTPFGLLDRLGGLLLGAALAVLVVEALLLLVSHVHDPALHSAIRASRVAGPLKHEIPGLRSLVPIRIPRTS